MRSINIVRFFIFWAVNTLSLWVANDLFEGISLVGAQSLFIRSCSASCGSSLA